MTALLIGALTILVSYLIGAIPFGYLVARWRGVDILHQGSGNIGATNVGRVLGRRFGLLVFFLDFTKGALPVAAATLITAGWKEELRPWFGQEGLRVAAALAAFLGHLFPVYLRFRGGKGVATGAGVVTMLFPGPTLGALFTWVLVVSLTRYVSLASLCAGLILCALYLIFTPEPFAPDRYTLTLFCLLAVVLIWLRHRANIVRLLHGNENRMRDHPAFHVVTRMIHVLALGLWFGSTVFFTFVVAPVVFHTFAVLAETSSAERATLPLSNQFNPETSSLVAGAGLRPVFPWYFLLQGTCGFLAAITALSWSWHRPHSKLDKIRTVILLLALATVVAGWPLFQKVNALRAERFDPNPAVAARAKEAFLTWHFVSLALDLGTIVLVGVGLALAAQMPRQEVPRGEPKAAPE